MPKTRINCKACSSLNRVYIDEQLGLHTTMSTIVQELARRGETFSKQNLFTHKKNHLVAEDLDVVDEDREQIIRELEMEMRVAPPVVAAGYLVAIQQLKTLANAKPSADVLIKTLEAITRITGMRTQQHLLMAYMQKAFSPEASPPQVAPPATVVRQLGAGGRRTEGD